MNHCVSDYPTLCNQRHTDVQKLQSRLIQLTAKSPCLSSGCHSDNEEDRVSRNGRQETLEFKDEEETVTTKSIQITQATETTTTTTRKRSGATNSKTLDLGAAAHYTGDRSPEEKVLTQTLFSRCCIHFQQYASNQDLSLCSSLKSSVRQSSSSGLADLLVIDPSPNQSTAAGNFRPFSKEKIEGRGGCSRFCINTCVCVCSSIQVEVQTSLVALPTSLRLRPLPASRPPLVHSLLLFLPRSVFTPVVQFIWPGGNKIHRCVLVVHTVFL